MYNPSTANEAVNDPTIRRCIYFAQKYGAGGLHVGNLHAYVTSNPALLSKQDDPVGPDNDDHLFALLRTAQRTDYPIICAWGSAAFSFPVDTDFIQAANAMHVKLLCLGKTKLGFPRHPLYLPNDAKFERYP